MKRVASSLRRRHYVTCPAATHGNLSRERRKKEKLCRLYSVVDFYGRYEKEKLPQRVQLQNSELVSNSNDKNKGE